MRELKQPLEQPYIRIVLDFLNLVLGNNLKSQEFWKAVLIQKLNTKYELSVPRDDSLKENILRLTIQDKNGPFIILLHFRKYMGLHFCSESN